MGKTKYDLANSKSPDDVGVPADDMDEERDTWSGKLDFVMSALSFAVGMGNLWRFPYLCYRNGGGAFLIPYVIMMMLCGYPLLFLELSIGQYARKGLLQAWNSVPMFRGLGWGMFCVSAFTCVYYNMTIAWCFFYLFASLAKDVPWRTCDNDWNTDACTTVDDTRMQLNCTENNGTWYNSTCVTRTTVSLEYFQNISNLTSDIKKISASEEYFHNYVLGLSSGLGDFGPIRWRLALCLLLCWFLVFISLAKGIKVSGKVTYVTALFPYVILFILLIRGVTLEGSTQGILFYLTPQWERLLSAKVWGDAAIQAFFSLSLCWGGMITLASYNQINNNCLRDSIVVATGDMLTSIFSGLVIFAILGYMAAELGVDVSQVAAQGPGLAFVVYPQVVTKLPVAPLWCALFMIMLINVGMGSQMAIVSTVQMTIVEKFGWDKGHRPLLVLLCVCVVAFLLGLTLATNGGAFLLLLLDSYSATYSLLVLAMFECISLGWVYGVDQFLTDIEHMIGYRPSLWWKLCWKFLTPGVLVFLIVSVILDFSRSSYGDYVFPIRWELGGSTLCLASIACVPIVAIVTLCRTDSGLSFRQKYRQVTVPTQDWLHVREMLKNPDVKILPLGTEMQTLSNNNLNC